MIKIILLLLISILFISCNDSSVEPELKEKELFEIIEEGLNYVALDVRSNKTTLSDIDFVNESLNNYLEESFDNYIPLGIAYNSKLKVKGQAQIDSDLEDFIVFAESQMHLKIDVANSFEELQNSLIRMVSSLENGNDPRKINALILMVNLELIYTKFTYQNPDLFRVRSSPNGAFKDQDNKASGCCSWEDLRKYAKCAVGIVSGTVKGTLYGCTGLGAFVFALSGGFHTLPVSATAAIEGCLIGGVLGGLSGAGLGSITGGCYD